MKNHVLLHRLAEAATAGDGSRVRVRVCEREHAGTHVHASRMRARACPLSMLSFLGKGLNDRKEKLAEGSAPC
jgi:hypothetical protein